MDKTIRIDLMSDKSTSDENETVIDKNSNNSARRDREAKKSDHNRQKERDSVDNKSASEENETGLHKSSNNSARRDHEAKTSGNKGRKERDSGEESTRILSASPRSENSGKDEENQTPARIDMNKAAVTFKTPSKRRSIFDFEDDDDVFQKKTPKNVSPADSGQQAKKIKSRRSSRIFERKRPSLNQSGMDDEIDEKGKKRRSKVTEQSQRHRDKPSTSSQMSQTENPDDPDSQETESDEEEVHESEAQRKARVAARSRSAHSQKILNIINQGSEAQLKSLSRIGPKTAIMLHQYRKLHGKFTSIMELEDMPGWTPKVFEQFLKANNIILD